VKRQIDTKICPTEKLLDPRSKDPGSVTVPDASTLNAGANPELKLSKHSAQIPIRATLVGSKRCEALGVTGHGYTPVLALCRALVAADHDPHRPLHVYRGETLALVVSSIGEGPSSASRPTASDLNLSLDAQEVCRFAKTDRQQSQQGPSVSVPVPLPPNGKNGGCGGGADEQTRSDLQSDHAPTARDRANNLASVGTGARHG
jgi:hypothetical protein